jgi:hypothetical protein
MTDNISIKLSTQQDSHDAYMGRMYLQAEIITNEDPTKSTINIKDEIQKLWESFIVNTPFQIFNIVNDKLCIYDSGYSIAKHEFENFISKAWSNGDWNYNLRTKQYIVDDTHCLYYISALDDEFYNDDEFGID